MPEKKPRPNYSNAWNEARDLIWSHRRRLALGLSLMLVNRLAGLVLPATSKFLIDEVVGNRRADLLGTLALAVAAATLVQAASSFSLSQVLGVAAQRVPGEVLKWDAEKMEFDNEEANRYIHKTYRKGWSLG